MRNILNVFLTVFLVTAMAKSVLAQGIDGTLRGEVKDQTGASIPGVTVTVKNESNGLQRSMETSAVGTFNFPNLLVGPYMLTVAAKGFKSYVHRGIEVQANQVTDVSAAVEIGAATAVVEVSGAAEMVHTTTSQLGTSWNSRQVAEIPLPTLTGNPQNLALFQTGTTSQSGGVAGTGGSVGGNRPRNNNFVVDGIDNNRLDVTGPSQVVIPDAVAEFTLLTNQFSAEYGHSTAGQFIQITKSGTNQWHGSGFEFINNRRLNSADNLTNAAAKPRFDRNRVGGTLGAPIKKDKLFIFGAYQYVLDNEAATAGSAALAPTAAGFATLNSLASNPLTGVSSTAVGLLTTYIPPAPTSDRNVTVANTLIPVGPESPAAPSYLHQHDFQINTDFNSARHRISGRVSYDRQRSPNVGAFPVPAFTGFQAVDARSLTAADVFSISPRLVNEFRVGYRRFHLALTVPDLPKPGGLDVFPNFVIAGLRGLQLGPNGNGPQANTINSYQATDTLSYVRGRHTFKGGIDYRWYIAPSGFLPRSRGEYRYSALDQFVKDSVPDNLARRGVGDASFAGNQKAIYWFFQDDWKVGPRLTLNLGLRYEYATNPRDDQKQLLNAVANLPNPTTPGLAPLIFGLPKTDKDTWAPRLGFAWDVFGDRKTSIRGGVGRAYDVIFANLPLLSLPPQLQQELPAELLIFRKSSTCTSASSPTWCTSGTGFIQGGGIPGVFVPKQLTVAQARAGTQGLIVDTESPDSYTWSVGIEREIGKEWAVEARYVGTRGLRLPVQSRLNPLTVPPPAKFFLPTYFSPSQVPANVPSTAPNLTSFRAGAAPVYAADGFTSGSITAFPPLGSSIYHAGSVEVTRRMSDLSRWGNGLFLRSGYTWSKTIDNSTNELFTSQVNPRRPEDFNNLRAERGLSVIDHRNKFTVTLIYELPKYTGSSGLIMGLLNQWQVSSSYIAETGQPVTALSFMDANGNGDSAGDRAIFNPAGTDLTATDVNSVCRDATTGATSIVGPSACPSPRTVGYVAINPYQFVRARPGAKTNSGRNTLISAGLNNWNLGIFKNTKITESKSIQFRADMINAFNHAQPVIGLGTISGFNSNAINGTGLVLVGDNPDFMKPQNLFSTGAGQAPFQRVITFGLKFAF